MLCSHGGCRGVFDTPRNLDDDQLRALAEAGGLLGLMLHPIAIGPEQRTIDGVIDHLDHAVSVMGVDRVCLGGDFTKRLWEAMPPPPMTKDGLMPPGLTPGLGIEALTGPEHYPRSSRLSTGEGGARRSRRRHRRQPPPLPARLTLTSAGSGGSPGTARRGRRRPSLAEAAVRLRPVEARRVGRVLLEVEVAPRAVRPEGARHAMEVARVAAISASGVIPMPK